MKHAPRGPLCAECSRHVRPQLTGAHFAEDIPPWLKTPADVMSFPGFVGHTDERHVVTFDKVLAKYDFGAGAEVACGLPGRHRHSRGYVVQTVCGLVLSFGHVCGDRWVDGLADAARQIREAETYYAARKAIAEHFSTLPSLLPSVCTSIALKEFRAHFEREFPDVGEALRSSPRRFRGAALWEQRPADVAQLHRDLERWASKHRDLRRDTPARAINKVAKGLDTLAAQAREARRWFDAALPFVSTENLEAVVAHFRLAATVSGSVITTRLNSVRPLRIGLGVYDLAAKQ